MKKSLKILSYNIHKGATLKGHFEELRKPIVDLSSDVVFLQEVLGQPKNLKISQFEYLAGKIWSHFTYGQNTIHESKNHGNAILSKYPLKCSKNIDISSNKLDRRGLLHAVIKVPWHKAPIHVICVHLGLLESWRTVQVNHLVKVIKKIPPQAPIIIAGDFNDWRDRVTERLNQIGLEDSFKGHIGGTFPVWFPLLRLDRIYVRGLKVKQTKILNQPPWNKLSDHAALWVSLEFI